MNTQKLDRYSFYWTEARLILGAIALFLGGVPLVDKLFGSTYAMYSSVNSLLNIAWVISGVVSVYLLYRWYQEGKNVFGGNTPLDTAAFFVAMITGLNLGIAGIAQINIGMTITMNSTIFIITGIIYLFTAWYLSKRWKENGRELFGARILPEKQQTDEEQGQQAV